MSQESTGDYSGVGRRQHYRLEYPIGRRPSLIDSKGNEYEVINISEYGMKLLKKKIIFYLPLRSFEGVIKFHDDTCEAVEGKVLRVGKEELAICLSKKISYKRMVEEQLYFKKHSVAID